MASTTQQRPGATSAGRATVHGWLRRARRGLIGVLRLWGPGARSVYHPQPLSRVVLGVALPPETDIDAVMRRLWWRGLGVVERNGHIVAGADVTEAVERRRMRAARAFVTRQLRDAGVRGPVRRWE